MTLFVEIKQYIHSKKKVSHAALHVPQRLFLLSFPA